MYKYTHTHTYIEMYNCRYISMYICMYVHMFMSIYQYIHVLSVCVCMCDCVSKYVCYKNNKSNNLIVRNKCNYHVYTFD